ncbi:NAD-dependent epimerase/dehydratase family protein [Aliidongia dinghuensis]|uniref:NAD-dependent epimerase/dehydratase family protein n=1 Tax=Aliidongia dinghuensis TaxID=1867774 RepID=UPI00166A0E5B|nr:NAD-dependent epimerase/dehydratase family protein [Aliidongia dinghuensis]
MRILVTGGSGFMGAAIVRRLAARGDDIRIFDRNCDPALVRDIAGAAVADRVDWRQGDIAAPRDVQAAAEGCDGIVHLAGVLTPACQADPVLGAQVNLLGTLHVFGVAEALGIRRIVYTSSAGVYGPGDGRRPYPVTHYGAFKLACEGSARAYWHDAGLPSVGFRPYIVYGPGRETGLTAGPSLACLAAARGEAYDIPYSGAAGLVHVDDVAAAYEAALDRTPDGAHVFNLVGEVASNEAVVAAIRAVVPDAAIGIRGPVLPFASDVEEGELRQVLGDLPQMSLREGIRRTVEYYQQRAR